MAWPAEKTALLVIHGMGEQSTFDSLDGFTRGLLETLIQENQGEEIKPHHHLFLQNGWSKNCISLVKGGSQETSIDCFEYYWAHQTQRHIDVGEVFDWLVQAGAAAQKYYEDNDDLVSEYEGERDSPFRKARFDKYWYLKYAGTGLRIARPLLGLAGALATTLPRMGRPIKTALSILAKVTKPFIVGYVGDVAIYTTTDMKSQHYEIRRRVLDGAIENIEWLLQSRAPEYGRIIVASHSLGSVIAYDALNRINNGMNAGRLPRELAGKLRGLVTFGSPLDKIAFFFRARVKDKQYLKQQIVAQHVGFKAKDLRPQSPPPPHTVESHIEPLLDHPIRWLNFWDPKDPFSGPLDFYKIPRGDNRRCDLGSAWGVAHTAYWEHKPMYREIVRDLLA